MEHTHSHHNIHHGHHAGHHVSHHEVKRGMANKKLVWGIVIVLILIIAAVAYVFLSEKEKPDPINVQCAFFCDTNQKTGFCSFQVQVNENLRTTCQELSTNPSYAQYNVAACPSISCQPTAQELDKTCVTGLNSTWVAPTSEGACPAQEGKFVRQRTPSDEPSVEGQICCFYYE